VGPFWLRIIVAIAWGGTAKCSSPCAFTAGHDGESLLVLISSVVCNKLTLLRHFVQRHGDFGDDIGSRSGTSRERHEVRMGSENRSLERGVGRVHYLIEY